MKKLMFVAFIAIATVFIAVSCSKDNGGSTAKSAWQELVAKHSYLSEFPEYTGTINFPMHNEISGIESVSFIDRVEEKVALDYYSKLVKAGFSAPESVGNGVYTKVVGGYQYQFLGSWVSGSFGLQFNKMKN